MSASPWPHLDAEAAPLSHMFKSPRDIFVALAQKSQQNPELMVLAWAVAADVTRYLDGEYTLREFARLHTPYERFRALRALGPDWPDYDAYMGVLDELIALHKSGKTPERPQRVGQQDWPTATTTGRHECANCQREQVMTAGRPLLCGKCRASLGVA